MAYVILKSILIHSSLITIYLKKFDQNSYIGVNSIVLEQRARTQLEMVHSGFPLQLLAWCLAQSRHSVKVN